MALNWAISLSYITPSTGYGASVPVLAAGPQTLLDRIRNTPTEGATSAAARTGYCRFRPRSARANAAAAPVVRCALCSHRSLASMERSAFVRVVSGSVLESEGVVVLQGAMRVVGVGAGAVGSRSPRPAGAAVSVFTARAQAALVPPRPHTPSTPRATIGVRR